MLPNQRYALTALMFELLPENLSLESLSNRFQEAQNGTEAIRKKSRTGRDGQALERTFAPFGTVRNAEIILDPGTRTPKGFAFVEMGTEDEAAQATIALNGHDLGGRPLIVRDARPKKGVWGVGGVNRKNTR